MLIHVDVKKKKTINKHEQMNEILKTLVIQYENDYIYFFVNFKITLGTVLKDTSFTVFFFFMSAYIDTI